MCICQCVRGPTQKLKKSGQEISKKSGHYQDIFTLFSFYLTRALRGHNNLVLIIFDLVLRSVAIVSY